MSLAFQVLAYLALLYLLVLLARMVFDLLQMIARSWRPSGWVLVLANVVYGLTDPPLRQVRRILPPMRVGDVSLDLAFMVVFLVVVILQNVLLRAAF